MARSTLPTHPRTGLRALGFRKNGAPIWPILGGSEPAGEPAPAPSAPAADSGGGDSFPANTPVAEMTSSQQAAYWKHQARKHEDRVKAYGGLTPDQLAGLQEKAQQFEALAAASQTDQERAAGEAEQRGRWTAEAELMPRLVSAEFRVAAAGRIESERLATILEPLDLSKFLTEDGDVDTDRVNAFIDGIAPARGTETPAQRRGPSPTGLGRRESTATAASVASGRDLYRSRHPKSS